VPPDRYGGTEAVVATLADELARRGHRVTLVAPQGSHVDNVELVTPFAENPAIGDATAELRHVLAAHDATVGVDVVIDHSGPIGGLLGAWHPAPVLHVCHGRLDQAVGAIYEGIAARTDRLRLVAISHDQQAARPHLPFAAVCHNGIDPTDLPFSADDEGYLAFVGRMSPEKAPDAAIRIARAAGLPLRMAAKCRERNERRYFAEHVEPLLGPDVEWLGELTGQETLTMMAGARALVLPVAWPEPFGMVLIEAMACGTPVLALARGAVPEVVEDGVTGFLGVDEADLVHAVERLGELDRRACRARVEERFSHSAMADAYESAMVAAIESDVPAGAVEQ